jgi:hypothetical protein
LILQVFLYVLQAFLPAREGDRRIRTRLLAIEEHVLLGDSATSR